MAFSLSPSLQALSPPISTSSSSRTKTKLPFRRFQQICASHQNSGYADQETQAISLHRRNVGLWLGAAVLGLSITGRKAEAAGKRAPPPPAQEKKDLSMTALQAKVLASKKRREAMKEEVARLRDRGKPIPSPSQ